MNKKTIFSAAWIAAFLFFGCFSLLGERNLTNEPLRANPPSSVEDINERVVFLTDYDEALATARRENKPALIFFMSEDCKYSRQMLRNAFVDPDVERLSRSFVCVEIDVNDPESDRVCDVFDVAATPTVQFVTSYGVVLQRVTRLQTGEELCDQMQIALTSAAWRSAHTADDLARR